MPLPQLMASPPKASPPVVPGRSPRVVVLFERLGPYHHARLRAAAERLQLHALELSDLDQTYAWDKVDGAVNFRRLTLFSGEQISQLAMRQILVQIRAELDHIRPEVVAIPGWFDRCSLAALTWCRERGVPAVVMSETTAWDDTRKWWKEALKRRVVGMFSTAVVGGQAHAQYLTGLGRSANQIFLGYDAVDNDYFASQAAEVRRSKSVVSDPAVPRSAAGSSQLPARPFFLASARFVAKKNLPRLLEAYSRYRDLVAKSGIGNQKLEIWSLVLLGDGPLRPTLTAQLSTLNLHDHVQMPGFKQYDELPMYYARAGAFIHASTTEQWGLVVNEAMASGLPVLVSHRCGCAADLVQEGVNGLTFDPYNIEQMAQAMFKLSTLNSQLSTYGTASQRIISNWGTERFAEGLSQAVALALKNPPPATGPFDRLLLRLLLLR
jgi:1,2-diacylglycerol 3-alpha-glucosyltransferase